MARESTGHHGRSDGDTETFVAHTLRADGFDAGEDGTGRGTPLVACPVAFSWQSGGDCRLGLMEDATNALHSSQTPAVAYIVNAAESCAVQSHARPSEVARCLDSTSSFANAQGGTVVAQPMAVRRLTPLECERLMGLPDGYTAIPYRGKPASDGPRYRALGNSMAVPVMAWIGRRILEADSLPA